MMQTQVAGFRLSPQQRRVWLSQQDGSPLCAGCAVSIEGELDTAALRRALAAVVARHEILRTRFRSVPGMLVPVQVVADGASYEWEEQDLSAAPPDEREATVAHLLARRRDDASEGTNSLRVALLRLAADEHLLLLSLPALCADERTLQNLVRELSEGYAATVSEAAEDEEEPLQYVQYSEWQHELQADETEATRAGLFWEKQRGGKVRFGFERKAQARGESLASESRAVEVGVGDETAARLRETAERLGVRPASLLLACWQVLTWRLTGQNEIVFAHLSDGRRFAELQDAFGPFAKSLPVLLAVPERGSFAELVKRVDETLREADSWHEFYADAEGATAGDALGFAYVEWPEAFDGGGVKFSLAARRFRLDRSKLTLECVAKGAGALACGLHYDPAVFAAADVERLASEFRVLLESALSNTEAEPARLELLSADERERLLYEFNRTSGPYPHDRGAHQLFEEQAARVPDNTAVVIGTQRVSYAELNARANQLARHLRGRFGVGAESLVGVCLERSVGMVVALVGVLKAGGAYVPLDTSYPRERIALMLGDARVQVLLTDQDLAETLPETAGASVLCLDSEWDAVAQESGENLDGGARPDNLAYVIYTSGSTGVPKGVMVTHRGLTNYLAWATKAYVREDAGSGAPVHSAIGFDLTVTSLYCPLLAGQPVELIAEEEGIEGLSAAMRRNDFSLVKITPSHLEVLNQWLSAEEADTAARALVIGGEALLGDSLSFWREHAPRTRLINEYGPTETVVGCCVYEVGEGERLEGVVPIGRPVANTRMYVLDERLCPVPIGVAGELYIGGAGVARGYLNRPELTGERFVPDEFSGEAGARLYRTGDVGRVRGDGVFEYLGRNDEQVKIRGFRIELGEVEAVLKGHPSMNEAVVIAHEDGPGERRLVAYVVMGASESGEAPNVSELRRWVGERLPDYMVPSIFVTLKQLPLTAHGKVDRRRLPAPDRTRPELEQEYVVPSTPVEQVLAAIWTEVLGIEQIGIHDSFFALGGDSIRSVRIVALARERGLDFTVQQLFQFQTIAEMARELEQAAGLAATGGVEESTQEDEEEMARLLEELEGISEEDVKTILRERLSGAEPGT
ncbi:MAG: non-ribosomal peptide synthetase [Pyrinomonadaceae bacterium]